MKYSLSTILGAIVAVAVTSCATANTPISTDSVRVKSKSAKGSFYPATASSSVKTAAAKFRKDKHGMPTYSSKVRKRYVRTTAYSHMENEPGAHGRKSAAGNILKYGSNIRSCAADWSVYPLGTKLKIKGLPYTYIVDDYGSALVGTNTVDIFHPSLRLMNKWGTRKVEITVVSWGSTDRSLKLLKGRTRYKHCRKMYYSMLNKVKRGEFASKKKY